MMKPEMSLRLRCIRCGDWDEMDPTDAYGWGLCIPCVGKFPFPDDTAGWRRWFRWMKGINGHPTQKALSAALEALESVPHGSLDTSSA
jgi:hypothetical protein